MLAGVAIYVWRAFPKPALPLPPTAKLMCPRCGHVNPAGFEFCGKCGTPLKEEETRIY